MLKKTPPVKSLGIIHLQDINLKRFNPAHTQVNRKMTDFCGSLIKVQ